MLGFTKNHHQGATSSA